MWGSLSGDAGRARDVRGLRFVVALGLGIGGLTAGAYAQEAQPEARLEARPDIGPEYLYSPDLFQDEVPRGETVRSRPRPELDALGLHVGSFFIFPSISNGISYDDNVFATSNNERDDFIYTLTPIVRAQSDWNRHSLSLGVGGDIGFYFDETSENYQDAFARAAGSFDVSSSTILRGRLQFRRDHEVRSDPNQPAAADEPTVFYTYEGGVDGSHRFNRVTISAGNDVRFLDYEDTDAVGGGTINNDDRDQWQIRPGVKVAYEFSPGYSAFVRGQGDFRRYVDSTDDAGFQRDSKGYDLVGGASLDLTGLLFGDFFAGIRQRFFDDSRFDTLTGPVVGSKLTWIPTGLTTVTLNIENQVIEDTQPGSSGYTSTGVGLGVDHELLRNLILSAGGGFRYDDFEGISREDKFYSGTVGAEYLLNRYLSLGARYLYERRNSNVSGGDYSRNTVSVSVTGKL